MTRRCRIREPAHDGAWRFCPWCGQALQPRREVVPLGTCARCGATAIRPTGRRCRPCFCDDAARHSLGGRSLEALAAAYRRGQSWAEIAAHFGLRGPRRGPSDAESAAWLFWEAAGSPGEPRRPAVDRSDPEYYIRTAWDDWRAARRAALRAWLGSIDVSDRAEHAS
jgi:hypothetical protein